MKRNIALLFTVVLIVISCAGISFGCHRSSLDMDAFENADAVFIGRVTDTQTNLPPNGFTTTVTFSTQRFLKGIDEDRVVVATDGDCSAQLFPGWTYLVYARK